MSRLPMIDARRLVQTLKKAGFRETHQKGSHLYLFHDERRCVTCVPIHPGDLKRPLLKSIIRQAGLTEDEFRAHL